MVIVAHEIQGSRLGITLLAMTTAWLFPTAFKSYIALPLLLTFLVCFVIPHGALDHIAFYQLYGQRYSLSSIQKSEPFLAYWIPRVIFYVHYLAIMALWGLFWRTLMPVTFVIFLVLSSYHFGEGDLDYINLSPIQALPLMLSRGLFLISLTLFSQPQATVPIVQKFIHFPSQLANSGIHETIVGAHFAILGLYALTYTVLCPLLESRTVSHFPVRKESPGDISLWAKEFAKALLFYTLFSSMNSLVAFALYLGPWHSVGHMLSEISFLKSKQSPFFSKGSVVTWTDTATFLWYCAPFTLIAVVSMASAFWITTTSQVNVSYDDVNAWALFIISISIFTGPHLWIVAGLHSIKVSMDPLDLKTTVLSLYSMPSPSIDKKVTGKTA